MSIGSLSSLQSTFSAIVAQQRKATSFELEKEPEEKKDPTKKSEFEKALEKKQAEPIKAPEKPASPTAKPDDEKTSDGKSGEGEFLEEFAQEIQNTGKKRRERRWKANIQPGGEEDSEEDAFKMLGGVSGQRINAQRNANHQAMLASLAGPGGGGGYQAAAAAAARSSATSIMASSGMSASGPAAFLSSLAATSFHNSSTVSSSSAAS